MIYVTIHYLMGYDWFLGEPCMWYEGKLGLFLNDGEIEQPVAMNDPHDDYP